MKMKILGTIVVMLLIATVIQAVGTSNEKNTKSNDINPINQAPLDIWVQRGTSAPDLGIPGSHIVAQFPVTNLGTQDANNVLFDCYISWWGDQGKAGPRFGEYLWQDRSYDFKAGETKIIYCDFIHPDNATYTCFNLWAKHDPKNVGNWSNSKVVRKPLTGPFQVGITILNPKDYATTIHFTYNELLNFPDDWDVELEVDHLELGPREFGECFVTINHYDQCEVGMMGEVLINAYAETQRGNWELIGDMHVTAIYDEEAPNIELVKPGFAIYLFGNKVFPWTQPVVIGGPINGEVQVTDDEDNLKFTRIYLENVIIGSSFEELAEFEFPEGRIIGRKMLKIQTFDEANNEQIREQLVLILKLS